MGILWNVSLLFTKSDVRKITVASLSHMHAQHVDNRDQPRAGRRILCLCGRI